jgi:hypothetical protein
MNDLRRITITTMVGLAVFAQLMIPTPVRADGEVTPPPSEITVQTATPEPTEVLPTEPPTADPTLLTPIPATEVASDVAPMVSPEEAARATAPAEEKKATRETGLSEMLRQLPADTSVKVLDENGQALPLVSQAAADVIAQSDPIWCPNGVAPIPGVNGCTGIFFLPQPATLTELLSLFGPYINAQNVDGTIWITSGNVGEPGPVTIDGSFYSNWANHGLNLQGGWSGTYGDTSIGTNSVFSVPITVANWNNTLFIGNLTISPPSTLNINNPNQVVILADVNANNVNIDHAKGRIDVYNSTGNLNITSADINNNGLYSSGINIHTLNGNVTISDSAFHGNGYDGIWMDTVNNVAINNSLFYNNNSHGAGIYNSGNISINGSAFYQNSNGNGIDLFNVNDVAIDNNSLFYNNE